MSVIHIIWVYLCLAAFVAVIAYTGGVAAGHVIKKALLADIRAEKAGDVAE